MKKGVILMVLILVALGCSKDSDETNVPDGTNYSERGEKVDICHRTGNGSSHVINVSVNAVPAHLAHGDVVLIDNDGDGFVTDLNDCVPGGDCDDNDPTTYPGAEEICGDGIDNNCDGQIDEDCCPCFSLNDILATNNLSYFDTMNGSFCLFDGIGLYDGECLYGVSYERFLCVDTSCEVIDVISEAQKASCLAIMQQAIAQLNLPEYCSGNATRPANQVNKKSSQFSLVD